MLNLILNILGIILIIYALGSLIRSKNKESLTQEKKTNDFSYILEKKALDIDETIDEEEFFPNGAYSKSKKNKDEALKEYSKPYNKLKPKSLVRDISDLQKTEEASINVVDLHKAGLSKAEIAKKSNRSIREIEVILKINGLV